MRQIILIGGGGHCKSCIEVIESTGRFNIAGILDLKEKLGQFISGYEIIGTDEDIVHFSDEFEFLITVGQIRSAAIRKKIFAKLCAGSKKIATIISPHALVSSRSVIGKGTIVMHGAKINADSTIGENCIINTNANIEHDASIGNNVHVSTNAVLNGDCKVGDEVFIGSGSVLVNSIEVASLTILGAGTIVRKAITLPGTYVGSSCRKIL